MPSKKPNKTAKKPSKAIPKKPAAKVASKKLVRAAVKAKPASIKGVGKTAKAALKPVPVKSLATKPVAAKPVAAKPTAPKPAAAVIEKLPAPSPAAPKPALKAEKKPKVSAEKVAPIKFDIRPMVMPRSTLLDEDGEESGAANLLAGPRNVKPYISRRGEQYMNKVQIDHFTMILQNWKRDLMVEVDRTVLHMKDEAANFPDPNDRATQEEEFSLELRTRDRERKLIRKIDSALKRIEDGSYGYCLETGEEIGIKRLEARPVATLSVEAQERRERREKQYGERDDRYR